MNRSSLKVSLRAGIAALALVPMAGAAFAQDIADVPREQTLVLTPWASAVALRQVGE